MNDVTLTNISTLSAILYMNVILIQRCYLPCTETTRVGSKHGLYNLIIKPTRCTNFSNLSLE